MREKKEVDTICVDEEGSKEKQEEEAKPPRTVGPPRLSFMMRKYLECFMYVRVRSHRAFTYSHVADPEGNTKRIIMI